MEGSAARGFGLVGRRTERSLNQRREYDNMNIAIIGCPGSGKGTQGRLLAPKLNLAHVSFGEIYGREVAAKTPLGHEVADYFSTGQLVPDWLLSSTLKDRFAGERRGLLFGGYPRTVEQAEALEAWLTTRRASLDAVFVLNIPEAEAARRIAGRQICGGCGAPYDKVMKPPMLQGVCDACSMKLKQRDDDRPEPLKKKFMIYREYRDQLLSYYRGNVKIFEIKAEQDQQSVTTQIAMGLKSIV